MGGVSYPVSYFRISEGEPLPIVDAYAPFRAVVVIDGSYSAEWQNLVSDWLVASGCIYMMAWGEGCSSWDDSVDGAQIAKYPDGAPDADFVMTTWHENETLEEVFWFARCCAHDPFGRIKQSLIVHVGERERGSEFQALFARSETFADPEDTLD